MEHTKEFAYFYHTTIAKSTFEDKMEGIINYYNNKMLPKSTDVAQVLSYCRDKLLIKPSRPAKNALAWLRLATSKNSDHRYDLSAIAYNGEWSWATDGARCHALKGQAHPELEPGKILTKKNEVLTPTSPEEAKYIDTSDIIKNIPDINRLMITPDKKVEVKLLPLPTRTYAYSRTIIDTYRIESHDPTKRFDGETVSFNRQYIQEATGYMRGEPNIYMMDTSMAPFMFIKQDYMALVMPTHSRT